MKCGLHPWLWTENILATLSPSATDWMNENYGQNDEERRKRKGSKRKKAKTRGHKGSIEAPDSKALP